MDGLIDDILAQLSTIASKKVDRSTVLETLFVMRSVFEARAKTYGEPHEFLEDMFKMLDILTGKILSIKNIDPDHKRGFFVTMLSLKLLRFANDPYGENGKECMLDLANYAVLCLSELKREEDSTPPEL